MAQLIKQAAEMDLRVGVRVYYLNPKAKCWMLGTISELIGSDKLNVVDAEQKTEKYAVEKAKVHKFVERAYDVDNDDLYGMSDLHPSTLLYCVKERFESRRKCYTRMGDIILSVNPFERMDYNDPKNMPQYFEGTAEAPHCWQVAHTAFCNIVIKQKGNQSILISGESGAGKTETTKMLMDYLGGFSRANSSHAIQQEICARVSEKLRDSNPILESFGNAKTVRNDNSSRFGKYIKLQLEGMSGVIVGAEMVTYLLEKSRICTQGPGERGYHVFYELLKGTSPEEKTKYGGLREAKDYKCLNAGNTFTRRSTDGTRTEDDGKEFIQLVNAMERLGINASQRDDIWSVLAAILHLQNVEFGTEPSTGKSKINNPDVLKTAARLLGVDGEALGKTFTIKSATNIMTTLSLQNEAEDMRDAVSKALYQGVFDWLVIHLNAAIRNTEKNAMAQMKYIGLLDIFGFENFATNSFEQLCINYTNEALQNHYNKYTFVDDVKECEREGIPCPILEYPDNQPCVDLVDKQGGLFTVLDQECAYKLGTDEGFTKKAWEAWHEKNPFFIQPRSTVFDQFGIHHYAGDVMYTTKNFLVKNADTLKEEVRDLMSKSTRGPFMQNLLNQGDATDGVSSSGGRGPRSTVSTKFKRQLRALLDELNSTESHFIRCIKPNPECAPKRIDSGYVLGQLSSAGVVQTIQMKREGYPIRTPHADFWARFRCIAPVADRKAPFNSGNVVDKCKRILECWARAYSYKPKDFAIGKTKVFMRPYVSDVLENRRQARIRRLNNILRPALRRYIARWREVKAQKERERLARIEAEKKRLAEQAATGGAAGPAGGPARPSGGLSLAALAVFEDLARIFPHFDLPVILGVVEHTQDNRERATSILMDMQRQRADEFLPRSMKLILDLAGIRPAIQAKMAAEGFETKDTVFGMSEADMDRMGFNAFEKDKMKAIILSQQSNWVANERLNQIYPLRPLNRVPAVAPTDAAAYAATRPGTRGGTRHGAAGGAPSSSSGSGRPSLGGGGTHVIGGGFPAKPSGLSGAPAPPPPPFAKPAPPPPPSAGGVKPSTPPPSKPAPATPKPAAQQAFPYPGQLSQMASMGFASEASQRALIDSKGDVQTAISMLLSSPPSPGQF